MIIPIRCFTCNKVLADKWDYYNKKVQEHQNDTKKKEFDKDDLEIKNKKDVFFSDDFKGDILNELNITKICCRRHMLGHVDLINYI